MAKAFDTCPQCRIQVPFTGLASHLEQKHPELFTACPKCKHKVRRTQLASHLEQKHPVSRCPTCGEKVPLVPAWQPI
jgi:DNA-directed RNA polymerase subunit RPC12/RpoP